MGHMEFHKITPMRKDLKVQDAEILRHLNKEHYISQRRLADISGYSVGSVNKSLKNLSEKGFIDESMHLTPAALDLFEQNRPRNAVILAAGFGMRMVPINWTTPKALLELNGEKLIDRLIIQLHEAGITDITVVAGFMKESLEYLIDAFGVNIVVNEDYGSKNNLASLELVSSRISNTYILPSDIWCEVNPFRTDELYSWYMVSDSMTSSADVRVNRKCELVKIPRKAPGNRMVLAWI